MLNFLPTINLKGVLSSQITLEGAVFSIDGTEAVIEKQTVILPAEDEPSAKKVCILFSHVN